MKLDMGSGRAKLAGYITVDAEPKVGADILFTLGETPPRHIVERYGLAEEIRAHHILEHVPPEAKVTVMRHLYDMLEPGGILDIEVPRFPHAAAVQDPTHVSFWCRESFWYFTKGNRFGEAFMKRTMGSVLFEFVEESNESNWKYGVILRKPLC